jgi:thioesterase domain-containing protein
MTVIDPAIHAQAPAQKIVAEFPCTQTQLRCWVLDQLRPGNPALNVAVRWEIRGAFKAASIEAAFRKVVERHEVLRTRFIEVNGQPYQQVMESVAFRMPVIDLRNVPATQREERIAAIGKETASAPFDLSQAGLFRVTLLMVENDVGLLLITAHQSCFDGWSIRVLGREVGEIASAIDAGRIPDVPELPLQYGDYALWQKEYLDSYGFEAEKAFWLEQLYGAPYFEIASDHPRGPVKTNRGEIISIAKPQAFAERIDAAARKHEVSQYSHGAAVLTMLLHRYAGASTVLFGSQIAGRDDSDLENLIGVFINNLVLRVDIDSTISFTEHLRMVSDKVAAAINHQRMPFNKLVEIVNPVRDASRNPLISVNFNLQKAFLEDHAYGGFSLISAPSQSPGVIYDLNFLMIQRPSGWRMSIEYNTDLFERATVERLLQLWIDAYEIALKTPDAPLTSLAVPARPIVSSHIADGALSPLEAALARHEAVGTVVLAADANGEKPFVFVTPAPSYLEPLEGLPAKLMAALSAELADADMPKGISVVLTIPRNADGSVNRALLPIAGIDRANMHARAKEPVSKGAPATPDRLTRLAAIWADILHVDGVRRTDDFFALGGHSLLALRMISTVREVFDVKADLAQLFAAPTLDAFARAIFGEDLAGAGEVATIIQRDEATASAPNLWKLTTLRDGSGPIAIYTINHPFLYYRLAAELPADISVHNINMFDASDQADSRPLEDIAADAVAAMSAGAFAGPIGIAGLCVNGIVAMEVARQLKERGADLRFTAIVDSWAPGYFRSLPVRTQKLWNAERRLKRVGYFSRKLLTGHMRPLEFLREFNATLRLLQALGIKGAELSQEEDSNARVTAMLVNAARSYRLDGDAGPVLMFRSNANHKRAKALKFGWGSAAGEDTQIVDIEGWHEDSLATGGLSTMAAVMAAAIRHQP